MFMIGKKDLFSRATFPVFYTIIWDLKKTYLIGKKKPVKNEQFFSGDQYFSSTNSFTRLKLTLTNNFYQLYFLLNKNQITEI